MIYGDALHQSKYIVAQRFTAEISAHGAAYRTYQRHLPYPAVTETIEPADARMLRI